jgi:hypothetical protein
MREREGGRGRGRVRGRERDRGREKGERCEFLTPLHDKSFTGQIVELAYFYTGGQGLLTQ